MLSELDDELDNLMVKIDSMNSKKEKKSLEDDESEREQDFDASSENEGEEDDAFDDSSEEDEDDDQEEEPESEEELAPEGEGEEDIGLNTDKIDYPEDDKEEKIMDKEAKKLPEIDDIAYSEDEEDSDNPESQEGEEDNESKISETLSKLKDGSMSGKLEKISVNFKDRFPEHEICCVTDDKIVSLYDGKAHETIYKKNGEDFEFNQPIRNKELEEQKSTNDAIIEKLLNFDNILTDIK